MHVNLNRGGGGEVGDVGAYGVCFSECLLPKSRNQPCGGPNVERETRCAGQGVTTGPVMGAVTIALFVQRIRSLGVCNHPKFSLSPCGLKARGQVILAGIILPPKDRAPKGTARLGIATRPDKISSLDFNKSILIHAGGTSAGHRLSGGDTLPLRAQGAHWRPSGRSRLRGSIMVLLPVPSWIWQPRQRAASECSPAE
jgi:hypothetical protein